MLDWLIRRQRADAPLFGPREVISMRVVVIVESVEDDTVTLVVGPENLSDKPRAEMQPGDAATFTFKRFEFDA